MDFRLGFEIISYTNIHVYEIQLNTALQCYTEIYNSNDHA